jgi:hypothetical protein
LGTIVMIAVRKFIMHQKRKGPSGKGEETR